MSELGRDLLTPLTPVHINESDAGNYFARPVGRMVRSAISRSLRAISTGSASIRTSLGASSQTSYCADRISALDDLDR